MPRTTSGSLQTLRKSNQERVLSLLLESGPTHRAELARRAGVSRTTVSTIVTDLIGRGLVVEADAEAGADGRAKEALAVNPAAGMALGLDFTFDHVWVHLADLARGEIAGGGRVVDVELGWAERIDVAEDVLGSLIAEHGLDRGRIVGAGIGLPGPIEKSTGIVSTSLPDQPWSQVHAADEFSKRLAMPVEIENNTRLEAVAEAYGGAGAGVGDVLYVGLSSGIAASLILDGRVVRGAVGAAGELGHTSINVDGPACPCGNRGCLVLRAGIPAILASLRDHLGPKATIDDVLAAAGAGDRACEGVLADVGQLTGQVLASLCNLLNPQRIVVGGELAQAGDALLDPMRGAIRRYALSLVRDVEVVPAALDLGARAGAVGGAELILGEKDDLARTLNRLDGRMQR
ncbi:ROK family transcriptional regulator [Glycomyces buryatensis]|uniref:ROK family transcriptional regulator n=1 Tax=Glycomyces buryatensis TaxID=2570927 RepID=A0A4S8QLM4_9ACTN|nr:ROK family transcriptional regulator [Glycomyces buryatensis]THV41634.1 ROK family transcriptional regulator [Glycomyces buryatensis]